MEALTGLVSKDAVAVANTATTVIDMQNSSDIRAMRIYIKNTGSAALNAAVLQGSMDGSSYENIDATAFTAKFGTLAGGAVGTIFEAESGLRFPYLRIALTCGTSTTVNVKVLTVFL